jgi:CubicO group peptidase (beta-lactamase class C family)
MQALDACLREATASGVVPGAVVCVGYRGELVWQQAYGAAEVTPTSRPMQCETLFDIASLTKVVATTSLVLWAQHERVCALDDAIERFYPQTHGTPLGTVTVRQLLAHTGGLAAWSPLYETLLPSAPALGALASRPRCTQAELLRSQVLRAILQQPQAYTPGTQSLYSDLGFILLGAILETCYQQALTHLFITRVAQPLGLCSTDYRPLHCPSRLSNTRAAYAATELCQWRGRVLVGEVHDENAWAIGGVAGHAGLFATAADLWRFAQALLDTVNGQRDWLPPALLRESWQRQSTPSGTTRALGWDTPTPGRSSAGAFFSAQSIGHLGFTGCSLWIDPVQQVIVVLCTNRVHPSRHTSGIASLRPVVHNHIMRALGVATP